MLFKDLVRFERIGYAFHWDAGQPHGDYTHLPGKRSDILYNERSLWCYGLYLVYQPHFGRFDQWFGNLGCGNLELILYRNGYYSGGRW